MGGSTYHCHGRDSHCECFNVIAEDFLPRCEVPLSQSPDKYDTATVPQYQQSILQALADGKDVAGVPEDAKAKATRWQRVSKVLHGERKKIQAKQGAAA